MKFIANQKMKAAFATNGIILTIIHWKISINLLTNSQKCDLDIKYSFGFDKNLL